MNDEEKTESGHRHAFTTDAQRWLTHLKDFSRDNRKQPTEAENHLWQLLRGGTLNGLRFRRQHAIGQFIVDFVCLKAWLIVEADGEIHNEASQAEYDTGRTYGLQQLGFTVIRFTNHQILHQSQQVLNTIQQHLPA
ncbi:endonuclease domain-containing protein [Hymenobacter aquaticus]|uniref:Endonuclease domain-containing protein n=1 Tax=Hymenobacter aquaticus TaxID=1867101 RepID=A0A4Z0Q3X2_9BACT|nr:endonuclease domain-containing protein [Hymenobacter aquaticus]TGE24737.1 endonuclease domain-containing protein [Hymenobacter aquaticus]